MGVTSQPASQPIADERSGHHSPRGEPSKQNGAHGNHRPSPSIMSTNGSGSDRPWQIGLDHAGFQESMLEQWRNSSEPYEMIALGLGSAYMSSTWFGETSSDIDKDLDDGKASYISTHSGNSGGIISSSNHTIGRSSPDQYYSASTLAMWNLTSNITESLHNTELSTRRADSSTDSIAAYRQAFEQRITPLLKSNPQLASSLSGYIIPRLHILGPLFTGDSLSSLFGDDGAQDGEINRGSKSSSFQNLSSGSSPLGQNRDGLRKRSQRGDDDDGSIKRRKPPLLLLNI